MYVREVVSVPVPALPAQRACSALVMPALSFSSCNVPSQIALMSSHSRVNNAATLLSVRL